MSMKKCKECGTDVSTKAKACPNCGAKQGGGILKTTGIVIGILILIGAIGNLNKNKKEQKETSKTPVKEETKTKTLTPKYEIIQEVQEQEGTAKNEKRVKYLLDNNVVTRFDIDLNEAWVDPLYWNNIDAATKEGIATTLAKHCELKGSTGRITIYDSKSGKKIAKIGAWSGFKVY